MSNEPRKITIAPTLAGLLAGVRRRVRGYIWAEGIAVLLVLLGLAFWGSLGFDWVFEPPAPFRIAILVIIALAAIWVVYRYIVRRVFVRLADRSMALVLERRFRSLDDSLLTVVELAGNTGPAQDFHPDMIAKTEQDALEKSADVRLGQVFNVRPLFRRIALACLLLASILGFGLAAREAFGIWVRRSLLLSDEMWPRKTRLVVEGFEDHPSLKMARGSDVNLVVRADAAVGRVVPEVVEVRYTSADGARVRENMSQEGEITPGKDEFQPFAYTFKGVLAPINFFVLGGDDRRGPFHLEVVDSPTINQMTLHCEFPAYTKRSPRDLPVTGIMPVPVGTKIVIHAVANKALSEVRIDEVVGDQPPLTHKLAIHPGSESSLNFLFPIEKFAADTTLVFTLMDTDGIRSRDPVRLALTAVTDEPPRVGTRLTGIGTAITPAARLPMVGEIDDDYGLGEGWFKFHVDENVPHKRRLNTELAGRDQVILDEAMEVGLLELQPKQKLHFAVEAADTYDLAAEPNIAASQNYVLDVVTPAQLRSLLEARELQLRRRFETILQEFTDTRDLLARIDVIPPKPATGEESAPAAAKDKVAAAEPGDEPGDAASRPAAEPDESPAALSARRKVQSARVVQNSSRSADETRGLAAAFDEIQAELVNNRLDTEELKKRLKDGISDPLRKIADIRFVELAERLKKLESLLDNPAEAPSAQDAARQMADIILVEMQQVLDNMLELETFNKALDLLRAIIKSQEELNSQTKERQKSKLRDLLEDED